MPFRESVAEWRRWFWVSVLNRRAVVLSRRWFCRQDSTDDREAENKLVMLLGFTQFNFIKVLRQERRMSERPPSLSLLPLSTFPSPYQFPPSIPPSLILACRHGPVCSCWPSVSGHSLVLTLSAPSRLAVSAPPLSTLHLVDSLPLLTLCAPPLFTSPSCLC